MTENIQIQNGDIITLARVMNENTTSLDKKVDSMFKQSNFIFNDIDNRLTVNEKTIRANGKSISRLALSILLVNGGVVLLINHKLKKIESRVKSVEDQILVDKFFGKKDEEDSLK